MLIFTQVVLILLLSLLGSFVDKEMYRDLPVIPKRWPRKYQPVDRENTIEEVIFERRIKLGRYRPTCPLSDHSDSGRLAVARRKPVPFRLAAYITQGIAGGAMTKASRHQQRPIK